MITSEILESNLQGNVLGFKKNFVEDKDINLIIEFMRQHTEITSLDFDYHDITVEGIKKLVTSETFLNLIDLSLEGASFAEIDGFGDEGVTVLAQGAFPNLTTLNLRNNKIGAEGVAALVQGAFPNLTTLNLGINKIADEGVALLAQGAFPNLTTLNLANNRISAEGVAVLAQGILPNLTTLNLAFNEIGNEGVAALAQETLPNLTTLDLGDTKISLKGVAALTQGTLPSLTTLDVYNNTIGDEGVALLTQGTLPNLTTLNLQFNRIGAAMTVSLVKLRASGVMNIDVKYSISYTIFCNLLPFYEEHDGNGVVPSEIVKKLIFSLAQIDNQGEYVKYFLEHSEEFPFPINWEDQNGNTLLHYYNNIPEMRQFLFEGGLVPRQEQSLRALAANQQGVHDQEITQQNHFVVSNMMETYGQAKKALLESANSYRECIKKIKFSSLETKLLSITNSGKRDTLDKVLLKDQTLPNNEEFVKLIIEKSTNVLEEKYFNNNSGYYSHPNAYNEQGDTVTIPETIGLGYRLITEYQFPIEEKRELLVTLITQDPEIPDGNLEIIKEKLGKDVTVEQLLNRAECHELLKNTNSETIKELFSKISGGLDLDETLQKQKSFKLAESLYWAATNYGQNSNACISGTWTQVANSAGIICPELLSQYADHRVRKLAEERLKDSITAENITTGFIPSLSAKLVTEARDNPSFKESLVDFCVYPINFAKPEEITLEQQRVMGKIYQIFKQEIITHLPNYTRQVPRFEEYQIIADELGKNNPVLEEFIKTYGKEQQTALEALGIAIAATTHAERVMQQKKIIKQQFQTAASDIADKIAKLGDAGIKALKEQNDLAKKLTAESTSDWQESRHRKRTDSMSQPNLQDNWQKKVRHHSTSTSGPAR